MFNKEIRKSFSKSKKKTRKKCNHLNTSIFRINLVSEGSPASWKDEKATKIMFVYGGIESHVITIFINFTFLRKKNRRKISHLAVEIIAHLTVTHCMRKKSIPSNEHKLTYF